MSVVALIEFYFKLIICITIPEEPKLVTRNTQDFDLNQHPFIEIPYTI
ncbi:MAG: type II toxin-antitoxin system VapC family toxin [Microcystis aeruginosa K13-07]|nr:type II toxin-antitoxin system VapC family toxin [Microcystis aeruginosa K13-07]